jgi:hypothetical protein
MPFRKLTENEIEQLEAQNCSSENWHLLEVDEKFAPNTISNSKFYGKCRIGALSGIVEVYAGIKKPAGIYNSEIRNAEISDNVYVGNVGNLVNYSIESGVAIENVDHLMVNGESSFGNGIELEVLNEAGGRELIIFESLTAQLAYLMVAYRHDGEFVEKLINAFRKEADSHKSKIGIVGKNSRILNCTRIENVKIGESATVIDVLKLVNGTIASTKDAPVHIEEGVSANGFIIQSGSRVDGGAVLSNCFIGQGVQIGKQYSAENSAFFANCEGFHGEACSIFAGPYSVTHHKSTLLIAGMFSFYNAGSGTNQSNHMYKLGPVHQGILERGSKTGSFSYMLWPSRVGAFSAVIGKHYVNFDSSDFPFSYITEEEGRSVLTPAMNLFTVGTRRDSAKWPTRDRRKSEIKHDLIHFDLLNPYTIGKVVKGRAILQDLYENSNRDKEWVQIKGLFIKRLLLKRCAKYYDMAIKIFIGDQVIKMIDRNKPIKKIADIKIKIPSQKNAVSDKWIDLAGMFVEEGFVQSLMEDVKTEKINTVKEIIRNLQSEFENYDRKVFNYTLDLIHRISGISFSKITSDELKQIITDWEDSSLKLNNMILADAQKEFDSISQIGFGIDGDAETIKADFENVRGTYSDNKFVRELLEENKSIKLKSEMLKTYLDGLN